MRACYIERLGPAEEIRYGELPRPEPGLGQVLVRADAVAVNPVDTYVRSGRYPTPLPGFPFVVGRDLVGVVERTGPAARTQFAPGQRVWSASLGHDGRQGAAAEYVAVAAERLYRLPYGVDPVTAVAAVHPAVTAYLGLVVHAGGIGPGDTVVVQGAAGNVGTAVTELAVALGGRVLALARADDGSWCREHGAAAVIDYTASDLAEQVGRQVPEGAAVWFDTSGRPAIDAAVRVLAARGRLVVIAGRDTIAGLPLWPFYTNSLRLVGFVVSTATVPELSRAARCVNALLAGGRLVPRIAEVLPLSRTARAHRLVEQGVRGRIVTTL